MTKELIFSDATKLAELIRTREVSPVEVVQAHLDRIAAVNPKINAIVTLAAGALDVGTSVRWLIPSATWLVPLNITGLPGLSMRFGTSTEGLPINVQIVGKWQAESAVLHVASMLEGVSTVRDLHPTL